MNNQSRIAPAAVPSAPAIGAAATNSPGTSNANKRAETGGPVLSPVGAGSPTFHASFVRVVGEGFDADQVTLPCEHCGLSEYSCECEIDVCPKCNRTEDAFGYCHCKAENGLTMEEVQARIAAVFSPTGWELAEQAAVRK